MWKLLPMRFAAAVGLSLLLLAGCHKTQPAQPAVATPSADTPPAVAAIAPQVTPSPPTEPATAAQKKEPSAPKLGDAYTANKSHSEGTRENDKELERNLADLRPKPHENVSLSGNHIDVNFTDAKLGPPGSHLCDLSFDLTDGKSSATATMTDKKRDVAMTVDLGWVKVKVKPAVSQGDIQPIGAGEVASRVTRNGSYGITLLDPMGKTMATAQITEDRRLLAGYGSKGYECYMRRDPEWEDEMIYGIVKTSGDESKVLYMRWTDKALTHHDVEDKVGSIFEYAFPAGELEIIKPDSK